MVDLKLSPFQKQCFVVMGAALNMAQFGFVMSFTGLQQPQLRNSGSSMPIDGAFGSWIAAIPTLSLLIGTITIPTLMDKYGRKIGSIISIVIMIIGWFGIVIAESFGTLLIMRFLQGASLGMVSALSPISVGECTSPSNRGAFLTTLSLVLSVGALTVHVTASYVTWQNAALICAVITFINLLVVIYSPESPYWLADQERYEECRNVFRWLRGIHEDDELNKIIEKSVYNKKNNSRLIVSEAYIAKIKRNVNSFVGIVKSKEFYKPIFIALHMLMAGAVCGANIMAIYTSDVINGVTNSDVNMPLAVISLDIQCLITNTIAVFVIKKARRRTVLFSTLLLNLIAYFCISAYTFATANNILTSNHSSLIGLILVHVHMFSMAMGTLPLQFIICGELFSLQHRSKSAGIGNVFFSASSFIVVKTFPYLYRNIGLYGTYGIYGCILCYCLVVLWFFLPETKDKTLQDIEDEIRGGSNADERISVQSLMRQRR